MHISEYSVKQPVTVTVLYALALGIAATLVPRIAVDLYPSISRPVLSVFTSFPGAGPQDVERNLTDPLEKALAASKGLKTITSDSQFESSRINLEFAYGTDMDEALTDAQTLVNRLANSLPDEAGTPTVRRFDMSAMPIMRLVVRGSYPPDQLRRFAEDEIQAELERIEGVASTDVTGGAAQIVKVEVSLNRLAAFNLTLGDVTAALKGQNVLSSGGSLTRGVREYQLMTTQELSDISKVKRIVVKTVNVTDSTENAASGGQRTQTTRLEDIAEISLGYNENTARVYVNGQSGVYIQITSESDSNQVQVARRVRSAIEGINENLPQGITLAVLSDDTTMIDATLGQVYTNAIQGVLLAVAILFLFLRNIKGTLIIGLSIPISILLTLMCMAAFGFTLNLLTMTGLIMGLGMTVDASIVILENVHNYRERGAKPQIAAILGSREMLRAIIASTATTLCVFIPLLIYKNDLEMMGQMFNDLIFTVIISLVCSLVVAVTLVPALCGPILRLDTRKQKPLKNRLLRAVDNGMERFFKVLDESYRGALDYCLNHRLLVLLLVTLILVFSLMQFSGLGMNMFVRMRTDDNVSINVTLPRGTTIDSTEKILRELEDLIKKEVEGYNNIVLTARRSAGGGGFNATQGSIQITLPPPARQIDTPTTIQAKLAPYTSSVPGASFAFRAGRSMGSTSAVEIAVSSRNYTALMETANDILGIITRRLPEVENPAINLDEGAPQLTITIDRDRAAALGVSVSAAAAEIKTAMNGTTAATMTTGDRLTDIDVMLRKEDQRGLPNLNAIFVMSRSGVRVPLSNLAVIAEGRAPSSIRREDRARVVRITGDLAPGIAATDFQKTLEAVIGENLVYREGVTVRYLGEAAEVQSFMKRYGMIIAVAVFLVFGVMASQFESFVDPLIIFFSIPLLFIGVIWIYKIGNQPMSLFSVVGVIALVGVVVNNGIVLVDYANTLRARGLKVREACLEAGRSRLRPILMTTLTTILGMAPIAFIPGQGAETIQPIGKTFVGGLGVSSLMTLFLTPVMYSLLNSRHDRKKAAAPGKA
ncbi:MAG: efflux RND transporter permease subunit [Treponema sp.]|jgi:HAE1 family hydrophobic/amphiphilic exporter-1|nr:efflux RND transporter permease subunit [Treponema sp.]